MAAPRSTDTGPFGLAQIFRQPLRLALATGAGLLIALLGDGPWDALAWALLTWPVAVCLRALWPR